jgi:hypothetical protein
MPIFIKDDRRKDLAEGITYHEFREIVATTNQNPLLLELARRTSAEGPLESFDPGRNGPNWVPPFAYGDVARASVAAGTRDGYPVQEEVVNAYLHAGVRIYLPNEEDRGEYGVHLHEVRTMGIQGLDQQTVFSRVSSALALFALTELPGAAKLSVMEPGWFERLMGVSVDEYMFIIFNVSLLTQMHHGVLQLKDLDHPMLRGVFESVSKHKFVHVITTHLSMTLSEFRSKELEARKPVEENLQRLTHNPLASNPLLDGVTRGYVAPVWHWIIPQMSTANLYYKLLQLAGTAFAADLGRLFEQYVGKQLDLLELTVEPEVKYKSGKHLKATTDYFVELETFILFIECKSTRPDASVLQAGDAMNDFLLKRLGRAVEQLNESKLIFEKVAPSRLSRGKRHIGVILTMEAFYGASVSLQYILDIQPIMPTTILHVRELESLVTLPHGEISRIITDATAVTSNGSSLYFDISDKIATVPQQDNPILVEAWESSLLVSRLGGEDASS